MQICLECERKPREASGYDGCPSQNASASPHSFLTSAQDGAEWSLTSPGSLTPSGSLPATVEGGGCEGLDTVEQRNHLGLRVIEPRFLECPVRSPASLTRHKPGNELSTHSNGGDSAPC